MSNPFHIPADYHQQNRSPHSEYTSTQNQTIHGILRPWNQTVQPSNTSEAS
ncbi:hypothetical protein VDG1235_2925 [Verrucomicrobiia bacterium DG1235]|nr:hypothetical protein VDG1235_2925 [Verrucomicrobiae bacterium DG1235]